MLAILYSLLWCSLLATLFGDIKAETSSVVCKRQAFQCNRGHCIHYKYVCDGIVHCHNGRDEFDCPSATQVLSSGFQCHDDYFQCSSGQCIYNTARCDGKPQCPDSSDEIKCGLETSGLSQGSLIGLTVSIAGLAVLLALIVLAVFCIQRKRIRSAVLRERSRLRRMMESSSSQLNLNEQPPRYSSRQELSVINTGYHHDEMPFGIAPPPYYAADGSHPHINEPPPSYSSHQTLDTLDVRQFVSMDTQPTTQSLWTSNHPSRNVRNNSVITLDRSSSISSDRTQVNQSLDITSAIPAERPQYNSNLFGNKGGFKRDDIMNNRRSKQRGGYLYVSNPTIGESLTTHKVQAGQSCSSISQSATMIADDLSVFNLPKMRRGYGLSNLNRWLSRSTPILLENSKKVNHITSRPRCQEWNCSTAGTSNDADDCIPQANCSMNRESQICTGGHAAAGLHSNQNGDNQRGEASRPPLNHKNISYNSQAMRGDFLGRGDLGGSQVKAARDSREQIELQPKRVVKQLRMSRAISDGNQPRAAKDLTPTPVPQPENNVREPTVPKPVRDTHHQRSHQMTKNRGKLSRLQQIPPEDSINKSTVNRNYDRGEERIPPTSQRAGTSIDLSIEVDMDQRAQQSSRLQPVLGRADVGGFSLVLNSEKEEDPQVYYC